MWSERNSLWLPCVSFHQKTAFHPKFEIPQKVCIVRFEDPLNFEPGEDLVTFQIYFMAHEFRLVLGIL